MLVRLSMTEGLKLSFITAKYSPHLLFDNHTKLSVLYICYFQLAQLVFRFCSRFTLKDMTIKLTLFALFQV